MNPPPKAEVRQAARPTRRLAEVRLVLLFLAAAFASSLWALLAPPGCGACEGLREALGGKSLAGLGASFYGVLLVLTLSGAPPMTVLLPLALASGLHAGLVALMARAGAWCIPCLATALAAGGALLGTIILEPGSTGRATLIAAGGSALIQFSAMVLGWAGPSGAEREAARESALRTVLGNPVPGGKTAEPRVVRLVAWTRKSCGYCRELERDVLPALSFQFGERLSFELRSADSLPGLPVPTILLSGPGGRKTFPGLPALDDLKTAILDLLGDGHERQALLQEPR